MVSNSYLGAGDILPEISSVILLAVACASVNPLGSWVSFEQPKKMWPPMVFAKAETDELFAIADSYGINSIPTIMLFKDGKPVKTAVGLQSEESLLEMIK